ncbi:MAG: acyltransferase [Polyangiaceae bacterium]|nr:acyltransferase [Polyangiaceae bacterium]MBK8938916.1 acyltransferase [Polyangiaceae bacterium]
MAGGGRLLGLDGLRAVSILMVMASHAAGTQLVGGSLVPLGAAHQWGKVGVRVFFVISGFLITKLMLDEEVRHGSVSIKAFYVRRAYRILPAYAVYLGFLVALRFGFGVDIATNDLVHAATYTTNFDVERHWFVSHIWSLSVEEQFYLLWPVMFALGGRVWAFWTAVVACVVAPICRYLVVKALPVELDALVWQAAPAVADSIATGCLLAFARTADARAAAGPLAALIERALVKTRATPLTYLFFPTAFFSYLLEDRPTVWTLVGVSFSNVGFALVVDRAVSSQSDPLGRLLLHPWLERLGVLSYSLYLWQQVFLRQSYVSGPPAVAFVSSLPVSLACALAAGAASYYLVEKPILRRRPRSADR